jgi:hypothetical protein
MKFGPRRPSLRGRIGARTSWKRAVRQNLGVKAPRGMGWITDPKKAAYNRVYNRTTFDVLKPRRGRGGGTLVGIVVMVVLVGALLHACGL